MRFLLPLLLAVAAKAQVPLANKQIPELNGGLDSFHSGNRLKDSESQIATNIFWDQDDAAVKRTGQALYANISGCTSQVRGGGVLDAPNGTKYMFAACGNHAYVTTGNGTFSVIGATISTTANAYFRPGLGQIWITDGVDQLWSTDGVNVSSYPSVAIAQLDGVFQNRLVIATLVNGESTIELSGYNNGGDFTLPAVILDTSPAIFGLNGLNDGRNVTCVFDGFRNVLILWNHDEMYGLYGSGNSSFVLRKLSEIGCDEQESVQEFNGNLKWLSSHGIYNYDGANTVRVSDPIKNQILDIIGTEAGSLSITQDSQGQWQSGNLSASGAGAQMSATIIPGDVVPSTAVVAETPSGLLAGTLINLSTATGGLTIMQGASAAFTNAGGESGNNTTNWDSLGGDSLFSNVSDTNLFGSKAFQSVYSLNPDGVCCYGTDPGTTDTCSNPPGTQNIQSLINFQIFSSYGDGSRDLQHDPIASSTVFVGGLLSSVPITLNIPISPTPMIRLLVTQGSGVGMFSVPFVVGTSVSIKYRNSSSSSLRCRVNWDVDESVSPQPGRYTSNRYYVGVSTPIYGVFTSSVTPSSDTSITFKTQVAQTNVSTLDSGVAAVSGGYIGSANGEPYVVVTASFTLTLANATIFPPQMSGWSIASDTTGYFIASCLPTSPNVGWGLFQATDLPGNGSVTFAVSTGTTCDSVQQATATWTAQTINQNITVSTASYLGIRVLLSGFTQFVSTAQPTLQSITANWTSSAGRPHTASQIYNNRYWLAFTTATSASAYNNSVLVLDEQNRWSNLSGINAASFMTYNRLLYSGSSLSDGNVNTQDSGLTDFGNPILLDFKSPTYELGAFNPVDLYDLNIEAQSDPSATPSLQYFVDNDTTPYTMGTINLNLGTPGLIYSTARFGQTNAPTKTHTLSYEILDTSYSPLTFYRSMIRFTPEDGP